jgi:hypothetical protein
MMRLQRRRRKLGWVHRPPELLLGVRSAIELAVYPNHTGVDVSETILNATRKRFANNFTIRLLRNSAGSLFEKAQLAL